MRTSDCHALAVAINAYFRRHPLTGSGQYLSGLLGNFPRVSPNCTMQVFEPDRFGRAVCAVGHGPRSQRAPVPFFAKAYFEQVSLPRSASRGAAVLHYPYWAAPLRSTLPTVVTVHDLIPMLLSEYRGPAAMRAYTTMVAAGSRRATMLIADSAATKRDILAHLRVPSERIRVIHLAPDVAYRPTPDDEAREAVLRRYDLRLPFVFYAGGLDRRKNVDLLIESFALARATLPVRHLLAVAGDSRRRGALYPDLPRVAAQHGVSELVRFLGVVPASDLPALYQSAAAFAFPSAYEGFGLTPLEALAAGGAVICSTAASLPEVVGDAAVMVDPRDKEAWAAALVRVLSDPTLASDLRGRGLAQAARFSWERAAGETVAVYREAVERWRHAKGAICGS